MMSALNRWGRAGAALLLVFALACAAWGSVTVLAQEPAGEATAETEHRPGGEANLVLPDLEQVDVGGYNGRTLLMGGLVVSALGILFGLMIMSRVKNMPVHRSMLEVSELIYET